MKKIGLTGVMGAGKSSVIEMLKKYRITVLDCDKINAVLLQKGNRGYMAMLNAFSTALCSEDGEINKQKMSDIIFCDEASREKAEQLLHPLIQQSIMEELIKHKDESLVVVEVPLLFEVAWESFFDEVWVVACDEALLLKRLREYRKISEEEAQRRLQHQLSQEEKIAKADVIIYNNADKANLKQQIYDILRANKAVR